LNAGYRPAATEYRGDSVALGAPTERSSPPTPPSRRAPRCSNPAVSNASCVASGFALVPKPSVLADVTLDGSFILTEPALAGGRVFVATEGGRVYMLQP